MTVIEEQKVCKEEEKIDVTADKNSSFLLFDEEVATLLLDMREKILKTSSTATIEDKSPPSSDEDCSRPFDSLVSSPELVPLVRNRKRKVRTEEEECDFEESLQEDDGEWIDGKFNFISQTLISKSIRKKAPSGSACEKHKRWKKRCPDNCPMRKSKSQRDGKVSPTKYFEMVGWSMIELNEDSLSNEDEDLIAPKSEEEMEEEEEEEEEIEEKIVKPRSKRSSKGRAGRKYLPQACDRHKILHAKCPANCPDRIKRDAELARQKDELVTNEMTLP